MGRLRLILTNARTSFVRKGYRARIVDEHGAVVSHIVDVYAAGGAHLATMREPADIRFYGNDGRVLRGEARRWFNRVNTQINGRQ